MSNYFNYFPKTYYNLSSLDDVDTVTNLTVNYSFNGDIVNNNAAYYEYTIEEGDTPEIVSYKIYGDAFFHWLLLKYNNITDVNSQWPLDYKSLTDSIEETYSEFAGINETGLEWAINNYHSYYKVITKTYVGSTDIDIEEIRIDANAYSLLSTSSASYTLPNSTVMNVAVTKTRKTYYDYEVELNEDKRIIKILKKEFINAVKDEFIEIMDNV